MFVLAEISKEFALLCWKFLLLCWHYALCFAAPIMLKIMLAYSTQAYYPLHNPQLADFPAILDCFLSIPQALPALTGLAFLAGP